MLKGHGERASCQPCPRHDVLQLALVGALREFCPNQAREKGRIAQKSIRQIKPMSWVSLALRSPRLSR
jgi:hypothetical protein